MDLPEHARDGEISGGEQITLEDPVRGVDNHVLPYLKLFGPRGLT